ncbi:hypothetical protein Fmac_009510 [Flemingia macrophylla]|uniref:Uncharacterized protein n=1 Tax=Flemingia macrophylla TaxID=520843 RepID=A0ABD1N309_9FABA
MKVSTLLPDTIIIYLIAHCNIQPKKKKQSDPQLYYIATLLHYPVQYSVLISHHAKYL